MSVKGSQRFEEAIEVNNYTRETLHRVDETCDENARTHTIKLLQLLQEREFDVVSDLQYFFIC
jgi:hypothetical protein